MPILRTTPGEQGGYVAGGIGVGVGQPEMQPGIMPALQPKATKRHEENGVRTPGAAADRIRAAGKAKEPFGGAPQGEHRQ